MNKLTQSKFKGLKGVYGKVYLKLTRYQVSYYEYALTNRIHRKFFSGIAASIFYWIVRLKFGREALVRFYELKYE